MLILSKYILLVSVNTINKYCYARVKQISKQGIYISASEHVLKAILSSYVLLAFVNLYNNVKLFGPSDSAQCKRSLHS